MCKLVGCMGVVLLLASQAALAQVQSVAPGINKPFEAPSYDQWAERLEAESREVYANRNEIVAASAARPGMAVGDIGAGSGLFTRLFAQRVGANGKVYAVDIAPAFVDGLTGRLKGEGLQNIVGVVSNPRSVNLPPAVLDIAFISDTYHHFEFPVDIMRTLHGALKPGGTLVVVDFERIEGVSTPQRLAHVRAGKELVIKEIEAAGFRLLEERKFMQENYFVRFEKAGAAAR
jgi:predicted methyltransferase